ncbi:MAG: AsmA family protein [Candidatus Korobacteraceae bacterium]
MKKVAIVAGIVLALLIVVLLVAPAFIDVNSYRPQIEAQLRQSLGRQVSVGEMRLSLLPPRVSVSNVAIAEDPAFGSGSFVTIPEMEAWVSVLSLLSGDLKLSSLTLRQPSVQLVRSQQGVWNFASLGGEKQAAAQDQQAGDLPLSNFDIVEGRVTLDDRQQNFRGNYENINVSVDGFAPDKQFDVEAAMVLPGAESGQIELDAEVGPLHGDNMMATPLDGELKLNNAPVAALLALANQEAASLSGIATGILKVRNTGSALESSGEVSLRDGSIQQVSIGYPISLEYKLNGDLKQETYRIEEGTLKLGSTPFSVLGTLNAASDPMQIDLKLSTNDASLGETAHLASAIGVAFNPGMEVDGRLTANVQAQGPANRPQMNGTIQARNISVSGGELKQKVSVPEVQLKLTPDAIRSNQFTATSGRTSLTGQIALTSYTSPAAQVDASMKTSGADLAELISIAQAYGLEGAKGMAGSGQISLDVRASGPTTDASALRFSGSGQLRDASLKPATLAEPLKIPRADLSFTQNSVAVQNLAASIAGTNAQGSLTLGNFAAPRVQFTLNADKMDVARLQQMMDGTSNQPSGAEAQAKTQAKTGKQEPGILEQTTGTGTITVGQIAYDQLVLSNVRSQVQMDRGVIRLSPLTASLFGGQQAGSIVVDTRTTPMQIAMETKLQKVQANDVISAVSSLDQTIYGLLACNAQANFRAGEAQNIASTLNGRVSLDLSDGRIAGIDMLNRLSQVAQFTTGVQTPGNFTSIARLTGDFDVKNGVGETKNLRAEIPGGNLAGEGVVNLVSKELSMRVTAVLSRDMSQRAGGTGIGGFMNTALANRNGELVVPVIITGTFDNPSVAPDVQKLAQMKLQNLLPTTGNPGSFTSGILGTVLGGGNQGDNQGEQQKGIGGIVNAITGAQQQQQSPQKNANQPTNQQQGAEKQQQPAQNPLGGLLDRMLGGKSKQKSKTEEEPKQ